MNHITYILFLLLVAMGANAQQKWKDPKSRMFIVPDSIYIDNVNGIDIFESDPFFRRLYDELSKKDENVDMDYAKGYFTNKAGDQYLKITSNHNPSKQAKFYTIGYTEKGKCDHCGVYLGKLNIKYFTVNYDIKLKDDMTEVGEKIYLGYYRNFHYKGKHYFYYEHPYEKHFAIDEPDKIYYYIFRNRTLIELGFGMASQG